MKKVALLAATAFAGFMLTFAGCGDDNNVAPLERGNGRNSENFSNLIGHRLRGALGESPKP